MAMVEDLAKRGVFLRLPTSEKMIGNATMTMVEDLAKRGVLRLPTSEKDDWQRKKFAILL